MVTPKIIRETVITGKRWLSRYASKVDREAVVKNVYTEVNITPGYFIILTIANLIALCGLITNSVAVIIGAMLISPLMSPILNIGYAFITGDKFVWHKSIKKIVLSVMVTLVVAVIATYASPIKDLTHEIISRTRPNLYDLIIAFLAGTAGAGALCTGKNYLTVVPGVAIATAVIPPLSVAGFGLGTAHLNIALGGFFLFFTNLVAIIISTCLVFAYYGFRPGMGTEMDVAHLKKRFIFLAAVLLFISIPLIYTLRESVLDIQMRGNIQNALKAAFDIEGSSSMATFNYSRNGVGPIDVSVVVNREVYMNDSQIHDAEKRLKSVLKRDVKLSVDQIKVQPGGLKEEIVKPTIQPVVLAPSKPSAKISREEIMSIVRRANERIDNMISPSSITGYSVAFNDKGATVIIELGIKRDIKLSEEQRLWLQRIYADELNLPVELKIRTEPFVRPLIFEKGKSSVTADMKKDILATKDVFATDKSLVITVNSYPASSLAYKKRIRLAEERARAVTAILLDECKIPQNNIKVVIHKREKLNEPTIRIDVR